MSNLADSLRNQSIHAASWLYPKYQLTLTDAEKQLLVEFTFSPIYTVGNAIVISKRQTQLADTSTLYSFLQDLRYCVLQASAAEMDTTVDGLKEEITKWLDLDIDGEQEAYTYSMLFMAVLGMDIYPIMKATHPVAVK